MRQRNKRHTKECQWCHTAFETAMPWAKFCSSDCRHAHTFSKKTEAQLKRRKEQQQKWGKENFERKRAYMLMYTYGITPEQYNEILLRQDGCCAVCRKSHTEFTRKLAVDHDHRTGEIFGLLCNNCNHRLVGKIRDPEIFSRAANYLRQGTGLFVPVNRPTRRRRKRKSRGR